MEEESTSRPSRNLSDQITDKEGETVEEVVDQCTDEPAEPRHGEDTDTKMDLSEGPSKPTPVESPGPDPTPPESKPKRKCAFVKIGQLDEKKMLKSYLEAYFDHFHYFKASGGELHGDISPDTLIYLEERKKGGLLHLEPPNRTSTTTSPWPRQRWVPEFEYDGNGEVICWGSEKPEKKAPPQTKTDQWNQWVRAWGYGAYI